jgi:hypothetical protein
MAENGDVDVNKELLMERAKTKMIKDRALPYFLKAVFGLSQKDRHPEFTSSLRKAMGDRDILPEFSIFVQLLEKKLNMYIAWNDHDLDNYNKKKQLSEKDKLKIKAA